jgi:hypothetical protein
VSAADQRLESRYWPTDKAIEALDGKPPVRISDEQLRLLATDLTAMDLEGAIDLTRWPAAAALVDAVWPVKP